MPCDWSKNMVTMLRVLISDTDYDNYTYSDARLEQILVVAAHYVNIEMEFVNNITYTINIATPDISPDPTTTATLDEDYTGFVVLKAACLTDWSTYRTKALAAGIKAKCGPAVLETMEHLSGFRELLTQGPCSAYTKLKNEYKFGTGLGVKAILSPFVSNNFDPRSLFGGDIHRYRK